MSELQKRVLRKLAQDKTDQEDGFGSQLLDALDRPGRATRAGIGAFQQDESVLDAIKAQFQSGAPDAPTGVQLAEHVQDKYDVQNPLALAAMATAADVADPTMFIPGGQITKVGKLGTLAKMAGKAAGGAKKVAKVADKTSELSKIAKIGKKTGMVPQGENYAQGLQRIKKKGGTLSSKDLSPTSQNLTDEAITRNMALESAKKKVSDALSAGTPLSTPKGTDNKMLRQAIDKLQARGEINPQGKL